MRKDTIKVNMNVYDIPIVVEQLKKLEQENKQLKEENKELNKVCELYGQSLYNADLTKMKNILTELEEWLKYQFEHTLQQNNYYSVLDKIQELKEKYKLGDKE